MGWLTADDREGRPKARPKERSELERLFGKYGTAAWVKRNLPTVLREIEHLWDDAGRQHLWTFHDIPHRHNNQTLHSTTTSAGAAHIGGAAMDLHRHC